MQTGYCVQSPTLTSVVATCVLPGLMPEQAHEEADGADGADGAGEAGGADEADEAGAADEADEVGTGGGGRKLSIDLELIFLPARFVDTVPMRYR